MASRGRKKKPAFKKPRKRSEIEDTVIEHARRKITYALELMQLGAEEYANANISVHVNSDGSIDGECRINTIGHEISIDHFLLHLEQFATPVITGSPFFKVRKGNTTSWMSVVLIRPVKRPEVEKSGLINRGGTFISRVATYWRKALRTKIALVFLLARDINSNFTDKRRLRVETIVYRLHYNGQDVKPEKD